MNILSTHLCLKAEFRDVKGNKEYVKKAFKDYCERSDIVEDTKEWKIAKESWNETIKTIAEMFEACGHGCCGNIRGQYVMSGEEA